MAYKYERCRAFGHLWDPTEATRKPEFGYYVNVRCTECGTVRRDIVNLFGELLSRGYTYPIGYKETLLSRKEHRQRFLTRITKKKRTRNT